MEFTVEFGDANNRTITLSTPQFAGVKIRGAWRRANLGGKDGHREVGEKMGGMPDIPGLRLAVDTSKLKAVLFDPLEGDEELLQRIDTAMTHARSIKTADAPTTFVPKQEFKFDEDGMKTLCLEIKRLEANDSVRAIRGSRIPSDDAVDKMPGHELFDPRNSSAFKPKHKEDYAEWAAGVDRGL